MTEDEVEEDDGGVDSDGPGWSTPDPARVAEMLGNRLRKNLRHLRKWARREAITCYRVYDRDIPEVPVTVDLYDGRAVLNDFRSAGRRPSERRAIRATYPWPSPQSGQRVEESLQFRSADRDEVAAAAWLEHVTTATATALDLAPDALFVKRRARMTHHAGTAPAARQYERLGDRGAWFDVAEGGRTFAVNLSDYLDTGLFLDHRLTRARVAAEAAGKRFLNLFCYTAAFTVHAAAAGAIASLSVDLSKTYLDWAGENFAKNALDPRRHLLEHGDVRVVLARLADERARFDLAVVDPPTFSNSKRMDGTFDVQRDHLELLEAVARVMAPGGAIWFSTNHRRFQLDPLPPRWRVTDETRATIPPDFRDPRIHRAYRIAT